MKHLLSSLAGTVAICGAALLSLSSLERSSCLPNHIQALPADVFGPELESACWSARRQLDVPGRTLADRAAYDLVVRIVQYEDALAALVHPPSSSGAYLIASHVGLTRSLEFWHLLQDKALRAKGD